jgi:hypothetical protein
MWVFVGGLWVKVQDHVYGVERSGSANIILDCEILGYDAV